MHITITEQEYKELMDAKRKYDQLREINRRIIQLKDKKLSESEMLTMVVLTDMLQELLA